MLTLLALTVSLAATPLPKAPPGFQVELVLEAPAIEAPTALCVAPNGDVYFAEDPMDMRGPPTKNIDRIWLLKGGDPAKKILFAEKMWAVMGLEIVGDKLYCVHAPFVTVFTLNPDGTAKSRSDLFTDLGPPVAGVPNFNDHIPSGIRMGMDGYLYVSIGDKGIPKMTRKETDRGSVHVAEGRWRHSPEGHFISLEGGGVIRFRPDGSNLEVFACGTRNHLDVPMDEHDRIFVRDNTDDGLGWNTRLMYLPRGGFMGYPWAYTKRPAETLPMIHDFGGGAPCGGWVYCDDGLPETYRGRIFHCEWGQGKVYAVKVAPDGAGFKYVDQINFLDPTGTGLKDFRPFTLRPTADGRGFYVTDWGHSGWLQPLKVGRIWKVTYTKDDVKPAPRWKDTDPLEQLITELGHPAYSERLRAQRALIAIGSDIAVNVEMVLRDAGSSDNAKISALWVLAAVDPTRAFKWIDTRFSDRLSPDVRIEILRILSDERVRTLAKKYSVSRNSYSNNLYDHVHYQQAFAEPAVRMFGILADYRLGKGERLHISFAWSDDPYERAALMRMERNNSILGRCELLSDDFRPFISFGSPLLDWLVECMSIVEEFSSIQFGFLTLTDRFDMPTVHLLLRHTQSRYPFIRRQAVETLARNYKDRKPYAGTWWGTQPARTPPPKREVAWEGTPIVRDAIVKALGDPAPEVRKAAVAALVEWADPETIPALRQRFSTDTELAGRIEILRAVAAMKALAADGFLAAVVEDRIFPVELRSVAIAGLPGTKSPTAQDVIAKVATNAEPPALHGLALRTLGEMKSALTLSACQRSLPSSDDTVTESTMAALASLGDSQAANLVLPVLAHASPKVRKAAIEATAALKLRAAVPDLIRLSRNKYDEFDALTALAAMPDPRALPAYLNGLTTKNADLRTKSRGALTAIRGAIAPSLEELAKRNELPPAVVPELRAVYSAYAPITAWKLIGPFPGRDKAYPPETEQKFDAVYREGGKRQRWRNATADPKTGHLNLAALVAPAENVCAYAYAEIVADSGRDAKLRLGSDDTLTVWLNGTKVYEFNESRGWGPDQATVPVKLVQGTNRLLIKCGNFGGPWEFSMAVSGDSGKYAFLQGGPAKYDLEAFRTFARKTPGDADRGQKLFLDAKGLACAKCHAVSGKGGAVGPDLAGIALKYNREDLMTSVLEPSKVIAQGYETINIFTKSGKALTGVFNGETADAIRFADADGKEHLVPKTDIEEKSFSPVSVMPNGLNDGMSLQDFADVIAYLDARKEKK